MHGVKDSARISAELWPREAAHCPHLTFTAEDLRHAGVSHGQLGGLRSPVSSPKDDVQQLPPSYCLRLF